MELLLHPSVKHQIKAIKLGQPHAILLVGKLGSGKRTLARRLASELLKHENIEADPFFLEIEPIKQSIGIEASRQITIFLSKKTTGSQQLRRAVIIHEAQTLTVEAQNALLKTLEEPPADTIIILTSSDRSRIKTTLLSRAQVVQILPVSQTLAQTYFKQTASQEDLRAAYHISGGQPGLLSTLLSGESPEIVQAIEEAKRLLKVSVYERLIEVDKLSKLGKEQIEILFYGFQCVLRSGLSQQAQKGRTTQVKRFHKLATSLDLAIAALAANVQPKLVLDEFFLDV